MPVAHWLLPTLKAILPHLGSIISATTPVFTKKRSGGPADATGLLQEQIDELQSAVAANAVHIKELAEEMQRTVMALEDAARVAQVRMQRLLLVSVAAGAASLIALACAVFALSVH